MHAHLGLATSDVVLPAPWQWLKSSLGRALLLWQVSLVQDNSAMGPGCAKSTQDGLHCWHWCAGAWLSLRRHYKQHTARSGRILLEIFALRWSLVRL